MHVSRFLLDPQGGEGGTPTPVPTTEVAVEGKAPDLGKVVDSLVGRHGTAEAAMRELVAENYKGREKARELEAKLPPEGAVILTGDQAKAWETYTALGKPEDVKRIKTEHADYAVQLTGLKRDEELRSVAETAGVKFPVLKTIAGNLAFETRPVKDAKTGKENPVVHVKDGDAEPVPLDDYAAAHWKDFLPALRPAQVEIHGTPRVNGNGNVPPAVTTATPPKRQPSLVR